VRRLLSLAEARADAAAFTLEGAWRLDPQVALRDESFGALAYHYGTRRLVFLKSRALVGVVTGLDDYPTAAAALDALAPEGERARYEAALARLADSGVIRGR
jgi:putative mycofactocin binding protein MftB